MHLSQLEATLLRQKIRCFLADERSVRADFLLHLLEYDRRKLYLEDGYSSLFDYCLRELNLIKGSAYRRIVCARLLGRFPQAEPFLRDGRIGLTNLALVKDVLTTENADGLLGYIAKRSKEEVERIVAAMSPRPALRDCVRKVTPKASGSTSVPVAMAPPLNRSTGSTPHEAIELSSRGSAPVGVTVRTPAASVPVAAVAPPFDRARPLSADLHRLNVTVSQAFMEEMAEVKLALSHTFPRGGFEEIVREGFRLILKQAKRRRALSENPGRGHTAEKRTQTKSARPSRIGETGTADAGHEAPSHTDVGVRASLRPGRSTTARRAIPARVKRQVWDRDGGCCTFEGPNGVRCGSRYQLEYEHQVPVALGGESTVANVKLLCRSHNQHRADVVFGKTRMEGRRRGSARRTAPGRTANLGVGLDARTGLSSDGAVPPGEPSTTALDPSLPLC